MVAFLTKTEGNDDFADIVDFLNASSIRYSLTDNPLNPQPTPSPDQSFHEEQLSDIPSSSQPQKTQKYRKGRKLSNRVLDLEKAMTAQASITHVKGDAEQVVIAAAEVVNAGVSVSTAEPKTPPITTTTLLEDDDVTVAATLCEMGLDDERARLKEAMRLQAEQEVEHAELIHLDHLLAQRMQEEEEMTEQQKKRQAKVLESAKYYTEEDCDIIRANGDTMPLTQTQQRTYHVQLSKATRIMGLLPQLKNVFDEEIKAKYERLVKSIANFIPMGAEERVKRPRPELQSDTSKKQKTTEVKEVPVTEEPVKEPTAPRAKRR
ncbi:hypothetical protein Tco_1400319 [Tanacetum coccineum]